MKRMGWLAFAHVFLVLSPGPGNARTFQSSISAPTNFTGTAVSDTSIQWSWNAVLGSSTMLGATHYELQEEGTNAVIATIPGPGTSPITYTETGLAPGSTYCRHVVAFNGADSASTADICVTTTGGPEMCSVTISGPDHICVGNSATYKASDQAAGTVFAWTVEDPT